MNPSQQKWNQRYSTKTLEQLPSAPDYLLASIQQLKSGWTLDVASGDGAVTLQMLSKEYPVTAIDISDVGLDLLQTRAEAFTPELQVHACDLEQAEIDLSDLGDFENIIVARYKPLPLLWPHLVDRLLPGGHLLITTFNMDHHLRTGFSKRFCLVENELKAIDSRLTLVDYQSDYEGSGMDGYLFCKRL